MSPVVPPSFLMSLLVDVLYEAGVIDEEGRKQGRAYLDAIPGSLKATVQDYEKWRKDFNKKAEDA